MSRLQSVGILLVVVTLFGVGIFASQPPGKQIDLRTTEPLPTPIPDDPLAEALSEPAGEETPLSSGPNLAPITTAPANVLAPSPTSEAFYAEDLIVGDEEPEGGGAQNVVVEGWNPPAYNVPLAHHPWDHYWFIRPVTANYNNFGLSYYPYGSNGPGNDLRIHHGIDISNPIGVEIRTAGPGTVIWADKGHFNEFESITSYGNTVVIEHDFGYNGQTVYTLYAHMSVILVGQGQRVEAGDVIGLIGNTGLVSGPHVHFEVRINRNSYFAVRNPTFWIAPYTNTGTVAGLVVFPDGETVQDAPVTLIDRSTGRVAYRTTTYAGFGVPADDNWGENFVFADIPAGRYLVDAVFGSLRWTGELTVAPGLTNWVEMSQSETIPEEDTGTAEP